MFSLIDQWKLTDLTVKNIVPTDESVKGQITDSNSEHLTDSDSESFQVWGLKFFNKNMRIEKRTRPRKGQSKFGRISLFQIGLAKIFLSFGTSSWSRECRVDFRDLLTFLASRTLVFIRWGDEVEVNIPFILYMAVDSWTSIWLS